MKKTNFKLISFVGLSFLLAIILFGCGKTTNILGWTHSGGTSNDPKVLLNDANAALNSGNYQTAQDYYKQIIAADPKNSEARYGYVTANMKETMNSEGMDVASLLNSLSNQSDSSTLIDPAKFDISKLLNMGDVIVDNLKPIADGQCDGVVAQHDLGMTTNLVLGLMLQSVGTVMDPNHDGHADYNFKEINGSFQLVDASGTPVSDVKNATLDAAKPTIIQNLTEAQTYLTAAVNSDANISADNPLKKDLPKLLSDLISNLSTSL